MNDSDELNRERYFLKRAVVLAQRGALRVDPNPRVGCVIVQGEQVVGEGLHERFGGPHAEVNALEAAGERSRGATLFVTLEPCSTHGKTPPCVDAIIAAGVRRVVFAEVDPNPAHAGRAIIALRSQGIECVGPIPNTGAAVLLMRFLDYLRGDRPFVLAKWAMTLDGKIATRSGDSKWITSEAARAFAHRMRGDCDGIAVGAATVRADRPKLTARPPGMRIPRRIVFSRTLDLPDDWEAWKDGGPPICVVTVAGASKDRSARWRARGADVLEIGADDRREFFHRALAALKPMGVSRLLVEGGGELLGEFFDASVVDQVAVFVAPKILGGREARSPVGGRGSDAVEFAARLTELRRDWIADDLVIEGYLDKASGPY